MKWILKKIDGHKTEIVAFGVALAGLLQSFGVAIPEVAWVLLGAAGLGAIRSAIRKGEI